MADVRFKTSHLLICQNGICIASQATLATLCLTN